MNVADEIGKDVVFEEKSHPSILKINENQDIHSSEQFQFKSVVPEQI